MILKAPSFPWPKTHRSRINPLVSFSYSKQRSTINRIRRFSLDFLLREAWIGVNILAGRAPKKSTKVGEKNVAKRDGANVVLLSGGNPQIAKGDGDAPVQAYIEAMPGWKCDIGRRLDALIVRNVPNVRKAVRWNSPFYGIEGQGWFLSYHVFTRYIKVTFFQGASLQPVPPGAGKIKDSRWIYIYEDSFEVERLAEWFRQAAVLPGWKGFDAL